MHRRFFWLSVVLLIGALSAQGPSATDGDSHAYFNSLIARSDLWKSYSLRDQAELELYKAQRSKPADVNYVWPNDPDARKQDAAKIVVPDGLNSLPNQVRLPMGTQDGHTYFVTWDAWFGREFRYSNNGIGNYKTFQFDSPRIPNGVATIWFEINNRWDLARSEAGMLRGRYYGTASTPPGPNTTMDPLGPYANDSFVIRSETWTRYWVLIDQRANDYERVSMWVADAGRGPVKIFDNLEFSVLGGIEKFWLEYNTSTNPVPAGRGPMIGYVRNVVMLRDTPNPTALMQRPMGAAGTVIDELSPPQNLRILR